MADIHRVQVAGTYHVSMHAVWGSLLFCDPHDYRKRIEQLEEAVDDALLVCNAFCLMGNHEHWLITVVDDVLANVMKELNRSFARYFNRRHGRKGRVYSGPYFSVLIESERHLLEVARYLALNPEEVGFTTAEQWPWSSYGGLVGTRRTFRFVDPSPILGAFGGGERAIERLREFVADGRVRSGLVA
jgi:REP element-mobilizing transposase RayT